MRTRLFQLLVVLILAISLFPATVALASTNDGGYEFTGLIESLPNTPGWQGDWVVSGQTVHVTAATQIKQEDGSVQLGACVKVEGTLLPDNSVDANKIEVKGANECGEDGGGGGGAGGSYVEFYGTVSALPVGSLIGDWMVSGTTVHVTAVTRIEQDHGPVAVNACVEVKGWLLADGSVDANKIETKESNKCAGGGGGAGNPQVDFYGTVESLPAGGLVGDWQVSGRLVHVSATTQIEQEHGAVTVGSYVEIKGMQQTDGSIDATKIEVKMSFGGGGGNNAYVKFYGTVQGLPASGFVGDWTIDGRTVHVDISTRIEQKHGAVAVGAYVEVKGWSQADGSVNAVKIEVKSSPGGPGGSGGAYTKFYGFIEALPANGLVGDWTISGITVTVTTTTRINQEEGLVALNAYVEVEGWVQAGGSVVATKVEVKASPDDGGGTGGHISFYGTVESFPADFIGQWSVSGRTVNVSAATQINQEHGPVAVGATVEVEGILQTDGSINATKIEVKAETGGGGGSGGGTTGFVKYYGVIEDMPATGFIGDWLVGGRTVHVDATTRIEQEHGQAVIGAVVEVKGLQETDGSVTAYKIEVKSIRSS